jgi:HSP20 family protein
VTWSKRQGDKPAPPPRVEKRGQAQMMWVDASSPGEAEVYAPPMDMFEREDAVIVELELPGVKKEAIEVYTLGNTVTVFGLKQDVTAPIQAQHQVTYLRLERKLGRFWREFELPVPCDTRAATARYDRGLLRIEFKKVPDRRSQRRKIEVK